MLRSIDVTYVPFLILLFFLGRAVRHINDYASVLLIDERYSQRKVIEKLPTWISNSLQCAKGFGVVQSSLVKFFKSKRV